MINKWEKRPYSWSQHNSFLHNKEAWYNSYVLDIKSEPNPAMLYGNEVGHKIINGEIKNVPRQKHFEYEVKSKIKKIDIIGFLDSFSCDDFTCCPKENIFLEEYKTSSNKNRWTQKSVDEHKQLDFYCTLLYLSKKINPKDIKIRLTYIPVGEVEGFSYGVTGNPVSFNTTRTLMDVLRMIVDIKKTREEMIKYIEFRQSAL